MGKLLFTSSKKRKEKTPMDELYKLMSGTTSTKVCGDEYTIYLTLDSTVGELATGDTLTSGDKTQWIVLSNTTV